MADKRNEFEQEASSEGRGVVAEFIDFLRHNKKYYLVPILVVLLAMGLLIILGGTAAAPFIYTLF